MLDRQGLQEHLGVLGPEGQDPRLEDRVAREGQVHIGQAPLPVARFFRPAGEGQESRSHGTDSAQARVSAVAARGRRTDSVETPERSASRAPAASR